MIADDELDGLVADSLLMMLRAFTGSTYGPTPGRLIASVRRVLDHAEASLTPEEAARGATILSSDPGTDLVADWNETDGLLVTAVSQGFVCRWFTSTHPARIHADSSMRDEHTFQIRILADDVVVAEQRFDLRGRL